MRAQLTENSKIIAGVHSLPELNHNEIVGWPNNAAVDQHFGIIWLLNDFMHFRNKLRYHLSKKVIDNRVQYQSAISSKGDSFAEHMFYLIHFGDWVSFWLAIMNNVDPTPIANITTLKSELSNKL